VVVLQSRRKAHAEIIYSGPKMTISLWRVLREIGFDIRRVGEWYKNEADAMVIVRDMVVIIAAIAGAYLTWQSSVSITLPALAVLLFLAGYLPFVLRRSQEPELEIGELVADDSGSAHCFHLRVKNLGPGNVKPTVTITHLADHNGKTFPGALESLQAREVHWRGAPEKNWHPELKRGVPAFAGVFEVEAHKSPNPTLCTYLNETNEPRRLWEDAVLIKDQKAIQLTLLISYKSSKDVKAFERHYLLTPDCDAPLCYRVERVKRFVNSQAILAKPRRS
jgi:hypothetical protein